MWLNFIRGEGENDEIFFWRDKYGLDGNLDFYFDGKGCREVI